MTRPFQRVTGAYLSIALAALSSTIDGPCHISELLCGVLQMAGGVCHKSHTTTRAAVVPFESVEVLQMKLLMIVQKQAHGS